jgi:hypothetical protein
LWSSYRTDGLEAKGSPEFHGVEVIGWFEARDVGKTGVVEF